MTLITLFFTAFGLAFSGALMPGPVLTAAVHQSSRYGARAGLLVAGGHAILEIVVAALLFYGIISIEGNGTFRAVVGVAGGCMLLLMAVGMARYRPQAISAVANSSGARSWLEPMAAGALTSMTTPYWYIWWATLGITYIVKANQYALAGLVVFYVGHVLADFIWYGIVGICIARGRKIAGGKAMMWLIRGCAAFLAVMGVWFLTDGLRLLA